MRFTYIYNLKRKNITSCINCLNICHYLPISIFIEMGISSSSSPNYPTLCCLPYHESFLIYILYIFGGIMFLSVVFSTAYQNDLTTSKLFTVLCCLSRAHVIILATSGFLLRYLSILWTLKFCFIFLIIKLSAIDLTILTFKGKPWLFNL